MKLKKGKKRETEKNGKKKKAKKRKTKKEWLKVFVEFVALGIISDIVQWATYFWWIWLFLVGWWWYNWAREHLAFSPLFALVVGGILVYYLVIEHPVIGSAGMVFWVVMTSGVIWLLPFVMPFLTFWKKPPSQEMQGMHMPQQ